jgi:hypothetical protein
VTNETTLREGLPSQEEKSEGRRESTMLFARVASRAGAGAGALARSATLSSHMARRAASGAASSSGSSGGSSSLRALSRVAFKSNAAYITYIVVGCVVCDAVYGNVMDGMWDSINKGKQYKDIDWSKFKMEDDDDEEEVRDTRGL